jgi:hypothetical protein
MSYDPGLIPVNIATLQIHRWDETQRRWTPLASSVDTARSSVSAPVQRLSTFALLGLPAAAHRLYLPVIVRTRR